MRSRFFPWGVFVTAVSLAIVLSSCAAPAAEDAAAEAPASDTSSTEESSPPASEDEGYAFGTDRDQMATAIEAAFATDNGKARWEGDTLVLALDGDADATMAGFTQCRVLMQVLLEGDVSVIEFPNGQVACADVLSDD